MLMHRGPIHPINIQSGLRNTDGLIAHRRPTSPQTGNQPTDGILQKFAKNLIFFSKHCHQIPTIQNQRRSHFLDGFNVIFPPRRKQPVCELDSSLSVGYQPVCGIVAFLCSLVLTAQGTYSLVGVLKVSALVPGLSKQDTMIEVSRGQRMSCKCLDVDRQFCLNICYDILTIKIRLTLQCSSISPNQCKPVADPP